MYVGMMDSAGYDLYEVTRDEWVLEVKNGPIFHGTLVKIGVHAVKRMGFKMGDIEIATQEMLKHGHNAAHFGMYRTFMFTFQKDFKTDKRVS